ncbi:MAG: hypothetical protein PHT31_03835 [Candidatus Omnitrophica bacterium]|nr:hypothetical protein [Candidatus Omnitrophota bacterium]MDD5653277.1 hypothetical protein [Candidatus Omnitrophota bacterium]
MLRKEKINAGNFRYFGKIIEYPQKSSANKNKNLFCKVVTEPGKTGWRIAYLVVRDKAIDRLERHAGTYESFEPVKGKTLLYLAKGKSKRALRCFYLDRPVVVKKGTWHGVVALDKEAEIKITENAKVKSEYWRLGFCLKG